jgi:hypothetical protein
MPVKIKGRSTSLAAVPAKLKIRSLLRIFAKSFRLCNLS